MTPATLTPSNEARATAQTWAIDASHTQVGFAVRHLMIANVKGRFPDVTGHIRLEPTGQADVDITINTGSITTGDQKRDAHLRSADFLDVDSHPVMRFHGNRVEGNTNSKFALHGALSIRGVSHPVTLYVINEGSATDPWGNERVGYSATASINRKDFGLHWNLALEAGGVLVGDEVRIAIETELVNQG
jgi:polyisoprenoid-binding protein YceI